MAQNLDQRLSEVAARLREVKKALCCLTDVMEIAGGIAYNSANHIQIDDGGGPTTYTIAAGTVHSIAWQPLTGSVDLEIGGDPAVEYPIGGSIEFSTTNSQEYVFTIVTGETLIFWQLV